MSKFLISSVGELSISLLHHPSSIGVAKAFAICTSFRPIIGERQIANAACLECGLLINSNTAIKVIQTGRASNAPCLSARTGIPFACNLSIKSGKWVLECNKIMTSSGKIWSVVSTTSTISLVVPSKILVGLLLNSARNREAINSCSNSDDLAFGFLNATNGFDMSFSGVPASSCKGNIHSNIPSASSFLAGLRA